MNYLIYGRVSTTRQAERELSIPAQIKACQKYATEHAWHSLPENVFEERGESARTAERPQLQKMLHRAKIDDKVDVILVHKLDRLCRNVADYAAIKMMLKKHDVRVISVVEQFDESFSGELVENIMASIAQWTSQNISWEVKKGLKEAVERGRFPGVAPLGYLNDKKTKLLTIDHTRAKFVKQAFDLYATGKYGYEALAVLLNERGFRARGGTPVGRRTIEHILGNPIYYGLIKTAYGTAQASFPTLISKKLFDDVQEKIQERNHYADRTRKHIYPLSGYIRCGHCGSAMVGQLKKGHLYYSCTKRRDIYCPEKRYSKDTEIEPQVLAFLSRVQLPGKMKKTMDAYFQHFAKTRLTNEELERKSIKQELVKIQQQIRNLVMDRSKRLIDAEIFLKAQDELLREKQVYQERLADLESQSDKFVQAFNDLLNFNDHADLLYEKSGVMQKRTIIKLCFEGFVHTNQKLVPKWTPVFDCIVDLQTSKVSEDSRAEAPNSLATMQVPARKSGGTWYRMLEL